MGNEERFLIRISRKEAELLRAKGRWKDVHMTGKTHKSRGKKYYLVESKKSMDMLKEIREQSVSKNDD